MRSIVYRSACMTLAVVAACWAGPVQAQGPGGGCRGGSRGTATMGSPNQGTPTLGTNTTGIVPAYAYYGGSSTGPSYYQQAQLAYQLEYLRQQQAYARQLEDQTAAVESARLHKVSLRQQRRLALEARRTSAKERRLAMAPQRRAAPAADRAAIGQLAANER
ncbi:MAG: hypothetical protein AB7U73_07765 [Pirellulales bacterium]